MSQADAKITILHLAVDFNTPHRPRTTTAIEWFVDELGEFENVVIAYKRTPRPGPVREVPEAKPAFRLYDFPFFGLPLGLDLLSAMRRAGYRTIARLEADGVRPSIVHAHKLTFEGLAGWYVARHFGVPLLISLRGEVETKVFRMKPFLRPLLRRICGYASRLYFVSAWFRDEFHHYVPANSGAERLLPNIVRNIQPAISPRHGGNAFVSVLNLDTWQRKGLRWLLDGFAHALAIEPDMRLDIIGGGSAEAVARVSAMIAKRGLSDTVVLVGAMRNDELLAKLPEYRGLLLPSLNETFGMVYVEALFAGIPVMFTAGTAIDGYLPGLDVARTVPPRDVAAIAAAIIDLWRNTEELRANIVAAAPVLFETFDPEAALSRYRQDVRDIVAAAARAQE